MSARGADDFVHGEAGEAVLVIVDDVLVDVVEHTDRVAELTRDFLRGEVARRRPGLDCTVRYSS